jgi:hypothetical protein
MRRILLSLFILSLLTISTPARSAQNTPITVTIGGERGAINPFVYGANYGPWALVSPDMLPKAYDAGLTFYRYPGGNWGDDNDLTSFHIDLYSALFNKTKATPSISVRLENGTPEKAAELVRMVNIEKKLNVVYWSIGNEPDLFPNPDVQANSKLWREIALAMRKVDPAIKFIGPDVSQFPPNSTPNPYLDERREWVREFLKMNGDLVDIVAIHRYPFPLTNTSSTTIAEMRANVAEWETIIPELRKVVREATGRDLPVAITEVNSHWSNSLGGEATPDSHYNAVWWAAVLANLIETQIDLVTFFALYSTDDSGSFGMLNRYNPRPTYYTYQLYKRFGSILLEAESADPDVVVLAAKQKDGKLTLLVVNLADNPKTFTLDGSLSKDAKPAEVWRLDTERKAEIVIDHGYTIPKHSVTLYLFQ